MSVSRAVSAATIRVLRAEVALPRLAFPLPSAFDRRCVRPTSATRCSTCVHSRTRVLPMFLPRLAPRARSAGLGPVESPSRPPVAEPARDRTPVDLDPSTPETGELRVSRRGFASVNRASGDGLFGRARARRDPTSGISVASRSACVGESRGFAARFVGRQDRLRRPSRERSSGFRDPRCLRPAGGASVFPRDGPPCDVPSRRWHLAMPRRRLVGRSCARSRDEERRTSTRRRLFARRATWSSRSAIVATP